MKPFIVVRLRFIGENEVHSMEYFDDEHSALQRFSNIWAADLNNDQVTWNGVFMFEKHSMNTIRKYEINDMRDAKNTFFILIRFFEKNGSMSNSVQYYYPDYANPSIEYKNAVKRWFSVIATDLNDDQVTANGAVIFDSVANVRESRYFE